MPAPAAFRIVSIGHIDMLAPSPDDPKKFENAWKTLMAEEGPVCARTGTCYPAVPKPNAVIIDVCTTS